MPTQNQRGASPERWLEMLADRFGAFEAIAYSTIKLARFAPADELSMDPIVAEAILEFGEDLRAASAAAANRDLAGENGTEDGPGCVPSPPT